MATQPKTGLTYRDLEAFPVDNLRRELIDGELVATPAPPTRHQDVVVNLIEALLGSGELIESPNLPGLSVPVADLLTAFDT